MVLWLLDYVICIDLAATIYANKKQNQHMRMISEGSCDTEDRSNDAEYSSLHHWNKLHLKIYYNRKLLC